MKQENNIKTPVILAIDGATKTGYAIYKNGTITDHGVKQFKAATREGSYSEWLENMIIQHNITNVVAEDIYQDKDGRKDKAFYVLAELHGVLKAECYRQGLPEPILLNPYRVKEKMGITYSFRKTPLTRAEYKQRMINRVTRGLGYTLTKPNSDDEADAIGILITYLKDHALPVEHQTAKHHAQTPPDNTPNN